MRDFLKGHRCNAICRHLGLPEPAPAAPPSTTRAYAPVHGNLTWTTTAARRPLPPVPAFCGLVIAEEEFDSEGNSCDEYEYAF